MNKILVSYFSASGTTRKVAENISNLLKADLFEIEPKEKYTKEDLDWNNKHSRSSVEMADKKSRPAIVKNIDNLENYDTVLIGFPIWWYTAPTIINSFIEENNLFGKNIYVFATSGGTDVLNSFKELKEKYSNLNFVKAKRFKGDETSDEYISWITKEKYYE